MIVFENRLSFVSSLSAWWPASSDAIIPLLRRAAVVTAMQCSKDVADGLGPYAFRRKPFHTLLIDLSRSEELIWQAIHDTSRNCIRQALRSASQILVNERVEESRCLINEFLERRRFRPPVSSAEWQQIVQYADVFLADHGGQGVATAVILVDYPTRARLLFAATVERLAAHKRLVGSLNRLMFWRAITHYKAAGIRSFDFGGVALDKTSPLYSITKFKASFGGQHIIEDTVRLAGNPLLRSALQWALAVRSGLRGC